MISFSVREGASDVGDVELDRVDEVVLRTEHLVAVEPARHVLVRDDARPRVAALLGVRDVRRRARRVVDMAVRVDDRLHRRIAQRRAQLLERARDEPRRRRIDEEDAAVALEGRAVSLSWEEAAQTQIGWACRAWDYG